MKQVQEDRKIALRAIRDNILPKSAWFEHVVHLIMNHSNPRAFALALILLKKYVHSQWDAVLKDAPDYKYLLILMNFLSDSKEPVLAVMAVIILNKTPRFNFQLLLLSPGQMLVPWNVYLEELDGCIAYSVIDPEGKVIMHHPSNIVAPEPFTLQNIGVYKEDLFREMASRRHLSRHDRAWSTEFFKAVLQSSHPLAMVLVIAKCAELNVWNDVRGRECLAEIIELLPSWVSIPGFISTFLRLSFIEFMSLNKRRFDPGEFAPLLMESSLVDDKRCVDYSPILELYLYLGLSLDKVDFKALYPDAKSLYLSSIGFMQEGFLDSKSETDADEAAESRGLVF